jgi:type IV pilus assembly protein PilM
MATIGPKLACEIGVDRVVAARASLRGDIDAHASRRLPSGTIAPGLSSPNVVQAGALRESISGALATIGGGGRSRDVIGILPDAAIRVLLVDFDTLPDKVEEAAAIVRFRVKKSLPFDVEHAALSFQKQSGNGNGNVRVVAALSPLAVIEEYENAFRAAGYLPGIVVPSILATLGSVMADRPTMLVKVDPNTTSVAIVDRGELLLLRTLDHPGRTEVNATELANAIHPSIVFFEDNYSAKIESIKVAGMSNIAGLAGALETETGVPTENLSGVDAELAGVAGAFR